MENELLEKVKDYLKALKIVQSYHLQLQQPQQPLVMCRAGDFVKEAGGEWIKVLRVDGRNIYLDYGDGLNCLDVNDVIAWKHGTQQNHNPSFQCDVISPTL
jgi:hypothetical protein